VGLRGGLNKGFKARGGGGGLNVEWHLEVLEHGGGEGQRPRKSMAARPDSVAWEDKERAYMWGPHVSDKEERRRCWLKAQTHEGNVFRRVAKGAQACRAGWASVTPRVMKTLIRVINK
jgi:hypothetical protein